MTKEALQFSVVGGSVWGNRGAEAMLMTVCHEIWKNDPETVFNVYSIYPAQDKKLVSEPRLNFYSGTPLRVALLHFPLALIAFFFSRLRIKIPLPRDLNRMRQSEALLDIGGITFADGRAFQLLYNVLSIWPAMLLGVPVIKLSQAMGPFETKINLKASEHFLPKCKQIFSRGEITSSFLDHYFPELPYAESDDIAFLYDPTYSLSSENENKVEDLEKILLGKKQAGKTIIALVPSILVLKKSTKKDINYPGILLNLVLSNIDENVHYVVLPNGTRDGSTSTMNNDILAVKAIWEYFSKELTEVQLSKISWVDHDINTRGVRELIGCCSALVTSRFHAMIAGLALCVPTMVIGWSHKYRETLKRFGVEQYAIDFQNETLNILRLYSEFMEKTEEIRKKLNTNLGEVKARSQRQFEYLNQTFFSHQN